MKLTFLAFGLNDNAYEPHRVRLFIESILKQTVPSKLILWDCSAEGNQFSIPVDDRITVIKTPISNKEINPAFIRNQLALMADTQLICHTNTDCYFAPNFAEVIIAKCKEPGHLIMCRHQKLPKEESKAVLEGRTHITAYKKDKLESQSPCGECQALYRERFIEYGGYGGKNETGIVNRKVVKVGHGFKEDTYLKNNKSMNPRQVWIEKDTHLYHLWHPTRKSKIGTPFDSHVGE